MPTEIYLIDDNAEPEYEEVEEDMDSTEEPAENQDASADAADSQETVAAADAQSEVIDENGEPVKERKLKKPVPVNDTTPLWTKHPNDCTEEEYKDFYRKVFHDYKEPLFWIHLNMDYPFNLKGILYFPKINTEYDSIEGTIKLYNNRYSSLITSRRSSLSS